MKLIETIQAQSGERSVPDKYEIYADCDDIRITVRAIDSGLSVHLVLEPENARKLRDALSAALRYHKKENE